MLLGCRKESQQSVTSGLGSHRQATFRATRYYTFLACFSPRAPSYSSSSSSFSDPFFSVGEGAQSFTVTGRQPSKFQVPLTTNFAYKRPLIPAGNYFGFFSTGYSFFYRSVIRRRCRRHRRLDREFQQLLDPLSSSRLFYSNFSSLPFGRPKHF